MRTPYADFHALWTTHPFPVHITQIPELLSTRLQSSSPDFSLRSAQYQIDKRSSYFWKKVHKHKKHTNSRGARIDRFSFCNIGDVAMWYIVRYINLPPTLCRSKQTPRLLFIVLPQQYFYLFCETAIQINEVQQHDIFCTSITLRGLATWVKSQQTITFPDISSPHSDRWWILPDKAFIIAENRECTKISSLFFSSPSSASLSKSRWTQLQKQSGLHTHTHTVSRGKRWIAAGYSLAIKKYILITGQPLWCSGQRGISNGNNCSVPVQIWSCYNEKGCYGNELWRYAIED